MFPKKKNIKTGTKSKVLRPVDKTTVMSSKSKCYRYLVLVKFVLFNIDYTYCDENHMVEEICHIPSIEEVRRMENENASTLLVLFFFI